MVANSALVAVVTDAILDGIHASDSLIAPIGSADIVVLANKRVSPHTDSAGAHVTRGAGIAVIAELHVVLVQASCNGFTRVVGAQIPIVAVGRGSSLADSQNARFPHRAQIPVLAGKSLMIRLETALACLRCARGFQADCIRPFRLRANHRGIGSNATPVGQYGRIALQHPVAHIPVFQGLAILVHLAVAGYAHPQALSGLTLVRHGAGIFIIAGVAVVFEQTTSQPITSVIGARVLILADDRVPDALAFLAMISRGAGVTIQAFSPGKVLIRTPILPLAAIIGATVPVIADADVLPFEQIGFIKLPVAVVIQAVAYLLLRGLGIAVGQSFVGAHPLSLAGSKFAGDLTGSP